MTSCVLTLDTVKTWGMRQAAHLNGGPEWFGYLFRCIEEPRLSRLDRYGRAERSVTSKWLVDGDEVDGLPGAIEALKVAPVLTPEEQAALDLIDDEFRDHRQTVGGVLLIMLAAKGQIEYGEPGRCRRRREQREWV